MPGKKSKRRTINVNLVARVEGEGSLRVTVKDEEVQDVQLKIFEPPRYFEAFLQGRHYEEVPDIVARICGICPIAYQMSAVHALERIFGITVGGQLRNLRRLIYCGEWIESHALHVYMLHAPDFFGYDSGIEMAKEHPEAVKRGLQLKKVGNKIIELLGGRSVHPVSVRVGGFSRTPGREELENLKEDLLWARDAAVETLQWVSGFDFPELTQDYTFVALKPSGEYPFNEGPVASSQGLEIPSDAFEEHFSERQAPYSNALQCTLNGSSYMAGPMARLHLNFDRLSPLVRQVFTSTGLVLPLRNPFQAIVARAAEILYSVDEAIRLIDGYEPPAAPRVPLAVRPGTGTACTEAPRGLLYHRYTVGEDGRIREATIIPPTSQNQRRIEDDLRAFLPRVLGLPNKLAAASCERVIRSYDPCISCATHFLRLDIEEASA